MSTVVAVVKSIVGQVEAVSQEGVRRVLIEGDRLYTGDQLLTGPAGAVTLEMADGRSLDLGRDSQWSASEPDSSTAEMAAATAQQAPSVAELQQAIAAGVDPTTELEATAAGPTAAGSGGAAGGGHSFVQLQETADQVDPTIGFPTAGLGLATSALDQTQGALDADNGAALALRPAILTLSATPSISEAGGVLVYTATVTQAPLSDLSITLSNGATIVILAGQTSGSVNVPLAPNNTVYIDPSQIDVTITGTTGGGGLVLTIDPTPAVTQITDTIDTTTVTLSADASVAENGSITYTATLTDADGNLVTAHDVPVTVTLDSGTVITIAVGQSSGTQTVTVGNDIYNGAPAVSDHIVSASGGNLEQVVGNPTPVTTTVTDSVDITTVTLTADASTSENGSITYTATLTDADGNLVTAHDVPVTVTLDSGTVITIAVGQSSGTQTVTVDNDIYNGAPSVTDHIVSASGGDFESVVGDPAVVTTTVSDIPDTTTVTLSAETSVVENGTITYTATLTDADGNLVTARDVPVTVTLASGKEITIAAGASSGTLLVPVGNDVYVGGPTQTESIKTVSGGDLENVVGNSTPVETTITDVVDTTTVGITGTTSVTEGDTAHYTVTLSNTPLTDVTITLIYSGTAANGVDFTGQATITIPKDSASATFDIATFDDRITENTENFTVTLSPPAVNAGGFENLIVDSTKASVTTSIVDNDVPSSPGGSVTGTEDTALALTWANFNISAIQDTVLNQGVKITELPADGKLQLNVNGTLVDVTAGQTISKADIDGGKLVFTPAHNESGADGYGGNGVGNQQADYAQIKFEPVGGTTPGGEATLKIDITPTADAPNLSTSTPALVSTGLIKETWSGLSALNGGGNGANTELLKSTIDGANPASATKTTVTDVQSNGEVAENVASKTSGLIYLEAGQTYTFSGTGDDSLLIAVGGNTVARTTWGEGGKFTGSVTPTVSGYYTLDIYHHNQNGPGNYDVNLQVGNGPVTDLSSSNVPLYTGTDDLTNAGINLSDLHGTGGEGYYQGYVLNEGPENGSIKLSPISTSLTDTDGSETLGVDISGMPIGSKLSDGHGNEFTTSADFPTVDVTGWHLESLTLTPPPLTNTSFNLTVTATSTEGVGGDSADTTLTLPITIIPTTYHVELSATATVSEGGIITYTATLVDGNGKPVTAHTHPVTVTLASGKEIIIEAGHSSAQLPVTAANDIYIGAPSVSETIGKVSGSDFATLTGNTKPAVTTVTDVIDTTYAQLSATPSVAENGTITYKVTLVNAAGDPVTAGSNMTITLSNNKTVTILKGASESNTVTSVAPNDVYLNNTPIAVSVTNTTGGNFEKLDKSTLGTASTTVSDFVDTTIVKLSATSSVTENGTISYKVTLVNANGDKVTAGSNMTITLSNNQTVTILKGASESNTVTSKAPNDIYLNNDPIKVSVTGTDGGNFEQLDTVKSGTASTTVTDFVDTTIVKLNATPSVAENGTITYNVTLVDSKGKAVTAGSDMTIALSNNQTVTILKGASTSNSVTSVAPNDVYLNNTPIKVSISGTNGGNFEKVDKSTLGTASTTVSDFVDTTIVKLSATPSVAENGTISYKVSLVNANGDKVTAGSNMTITLSNDKTVTILKGASESNTVTSVAPNDVYLNNTPIAVSVTNTTGGNFEKLDKSTQGTASTTVSDVVDTTIVKLNATPSVAENGTITYNVTLVDSKGKAVTAGSDMTIALSNNQTVTILKGASTSNSVTSVAPNDVYLNNTPIAVSVTNTTGGNFEKVDKSTLGTASTTVSDFVDTTIVKLSATPSVAENGSITYTVTLVNANGDPVKAGSDMTIMLSNKQTVTILKDASESNTVTSVAPNDVYLNNKPITVSVTGTSGGNFEQLDTVKSGTASTTVTDFVDTTIVKLSATPSVAENGSITYKVTLVNANGDPVKAGSDMTITLSNKQTVTILKDASESNTVTSVAPNDVYLNNTPITVSVTGTSGGNFEQLDTVKSGTASTTVTDFVDTTIVKLSATPSVAENGTITYKVTLVNANGDPVKAGSDMTITLSNNQTVTILKDASESNAVTSVAPNDIYTGNKPIIVSITETGGGSFEKLDTTSTAATTVTDLNDVTTVKLTATPSVAENGIIDYKVTLVNANGDPVKAGSDMTITLSNNQTVTILKDASESNTASTVAPNDIYINNAPITVSITDTSGGKFEQLDTVKSGTASTTVTDLNDVTTVKLTATPSVSENGAITYSATLVGGNGKPVTAGSAMTIELSNGKTLTIAKGASTSNTATTTAPNDVYKDNAAIDVKINGTSGGNFEQLDTSSKATTTVTDVNDTTTVGITGSTSVTEGQTGHYTVTLSNTAHEDVTITLTYKGTAENGVDFTGQTTVTIAKNSASTTFDIATIDDRIPEKTENFTVTLSPPAVNAGGFENLIVDSGKASVTTNITDSQDTVYAKISIDGNATVTEGGVLTYKVELVDQHGSPVTVPSGKSVTVSLDWSGTADASDITGKLPTSVTISGGTSSTSFPVQTFDDTKVESTESLVATIKTVTDNNDIFEHLVVGAQNNATGTILDHDKGPTATSDTATIQESGKSGGSDVVLILDRSGSMGPAGNGQNGSDPDGNGPYTSRLEMLKESVKNLFASGTVHAVFIVTFSSDSTALNSGKDGGWYTNLDDAMTAINKMTADGTTSYDSALNTVINSFTAPPAGGDKLVSIFMSDGVPNNGTAPESAWIKFLETKKFADSFAVGFGGLSSDNKDYLEPIAWAPGEKTGTYTSGAADNHVLVVDTSVSALTNALVTSAGGSVFSGNVTADDSGGTAGWATNGWKLVSVQFNDVTYTFTSATEVKTIDLGNVGKLTIKADGSYTFTGKDNFDTPTSIQAVLNYTVKDAVGTTASSTLTLTVNDRGDPIATDDNVTTTLVSKLVTPVAQTLTDFSASTTNKWTFSTDKTLDQTGSNWSTDEVLKANLNGWQSSSLINTTPDAKITGSSNPALTVTDSNGFNSKINNGDAQVLTPTYTTGASSGETLSFSTSTAFKSGDTAAWTLFKSIDGGLTWTSAQTGSITTSTKLVTTRALDANTDYRLYLNVHDGSGTTSGSKAAVTFDDFKVNFPKDSGIEWTATPVTGSVKDNDVWGTHGETSTLSVKIKDAWVNATTAGTEIKGEYGTLTIKSDGSYTYTATNNKDSVGHMDQFEYKLTQADGDTASAHLNITINGTGPGIESKVAAFSLLATDDQDILFTHSDTHTVLAGHGDNILVGTSGADIFVWKTGDTGHDVIKDFSQAQGDKIDLSELLKDVGNNDLSNYLQTTTTDNVTTLQVSTAGKLNAEGGTANADVSIKLEGNNWSGSSIDSLIAGGDLTIKHDASHG